MTYSTTRSLGCKGKLKNGFHGFHLSWATSSNQPSQDPVNRFKGAERPSPSPTKDEHRSPTQQELIGQSDGNDNSARWKAGSATGENSTWSSMQSFPCPGSSSSVVTCGLRTETNHVQY